jgi:hypothetical protein
MQRSIPLLAVLLALAAAACGSLSSSGLDSKVKAAVEAKGGAGAVSNVDCNNTAPPPDTIGGGVVSVHAEHTCIVTFSDGRPQQVWAVHVMDLIATHPVQLLYRVDHNGTPPPVAVNVARAFSAEMAILNGGAAVKGAHCKAGSPAPPGGASFAPADHVCTARLAGGRQRWAVRVAGSNVQLLFKLS